MSGLKMGEPVLAFIKEDVNGNLILAWRKVLLRFFHASGDRTSFKPSRDSLPRQPGVCPWRRAVDFLLGDGSVRGRAGTADRNVVTASGPAVPQ